jgi:putative ABC transport system permease protein
MNDFLQDIRFSLRMMRKNPAFAVVAIIALALGIGANSAIFSVVNSVLLNPLPFKEPDRLSRIWGKFEKDGIPQNWISEPELFDLRELCQSFEGIAAYSTGGLNLTGNEDPIRVDTTSVNANFFDVLGVSPALGRTFTEEDDQAGHGQVVMVSHGLWRRRYNSDPGLLGNTIALNGQPYTVVGIMPEGFRYPGADLWVPLALDRANLNSRGSHYLEVIARLKPGVTMEQVSAELNTVAGTLTQQNPNNYRPEAGFGLYPVSMAEEVVGKIRPALLVLMGAVGFVLLIACANVANLLLARSAAREKEVAIRAALGASRGRLVRQLMTESVILALLGGAAGLALAYAGVRSFVVFGPEDIPRISEIGLDGRVLAFSVAVSLLTGLIFGLAPAIQSSKTDLHDSLKEGGRGSTSGRHRLRDLLVVSEVGLALVLLIGAGLMIRSFWRLLDVDLGYRKDHLLTMRLSIPQSKYDDNTKIAAFYARLLDEVRPLPGVESVGVVSQLPLSGAYSSGSTAIDDQKAGEGLPQFQGYPYIEADRRAVSAGYFESLGISLLQGRPLTEADTADSPKVAVVDEDFVRRFWPDGNAVGKHISVGGGPQGIQWGDIVGVVRHIHHYGPEKEGREQAYFPYQQRPARTMYLAIRTAADPASLAGAVREKVRGIDKDQPVYEVRTMNQLVSASVAQPRLNLVLLGVFAAVALILAATGIYGVMSYSVTQRTHEIGIRMALGAGSTNVMRLVVGRGMVLAGVGVAIGLAAAFAMTRVMASLLFGVSATDPVTFVVIAIVLIVVALIASVIPARRAVRVDPIVALRYE